MNFHVELNEKVFWDEAVVVDIPFFPFEKYNKTEIKILDYVANRVLQIARDVRRVKFCEGDFDWLKDRHFTQSPSIVAIDTANITTENKTYLDYVFQISRVHPSLLINCEIEKDELLSIRLHHDLKKEGYILPVFRRTPAADIVYMRHKFGEYFVDLVRGDYDSIDKGKIEALGNKFTEQDIINRFPGVFFKNDKLFHRPEIVWVGVDSKEISTGLTHLFNFNKKEFDIEWFCNKFKVDFEELKPYLVECMLFGKGSKKGSLKFRLNKNLIYPKLMHALMHQFESKMIEAGAIDSTHGEYPGFKSGEVVEYHSLGKLFDMKDTFSCKLLCYVRQCLSSQPYNKIILVDNGKENGLYELLPKIFGIEKKNLIRIINFFDEPVLYPFDKLEVGGKVAIITDVINTGSFINKVCNMLLKNKLEIQTIFSFIKNIDVPRSNFFKNISKSSNISIYSFFEKKLNNIDDVRLPDHIRRFGINAKSFSDNQIELRIGHNGGYSSNRESYLTFWSTANQFCEVNRNYLSCDSSYTASDGSHTSLKSSWCHDLSFKLDAHESLSQPHLFNLFLQQFFRLKSFDLILIVDNSNFISWSKIIKDLANTGHIYNLEVRLSSIDNKENIQNVLVVTTSFNVGRTIADAAKKIRNQLENVTKISCLSLLSKMNIINETTKEYNQNIEELLSQDLVFHCFYLSCLPFYLTEPNNGFFEFYDTQLKQLCN